MQKSGWNRLTKLFRFLPYLFVLKGFPYQQKLENRSIAYELIGSSLFDNCDNFYAFQQFAPIPNPPVISIVHGTFEEYSNFSLSKKAVTVHSVMNDSGLLP